VIYPVSVNARYVLCCCDTVCHLPHAAGPALPGEVSGQWRQPLQRFLVAVSSTSRRALCAVAHQTPCLLHEIIIETPCYSLGNFGSAQQRSAGVAQLLVMVLMCLVNRNIVKAKQYHNTSIEAQGKRCRSYSFTTSELDEGEWSASRFGRALAPGKGPRLPIVQEAGWTQEPVWTQSSEEISFCLCRGSNFDRPVFHSVARHYTELPMLPVETLCPVIVETCQLMVSCVRTGHFSFRTMTKTALKSHSVPRKPCVGDDECRDVEIIAYTLLSSSVV
jgi:hypothetical protein